MNILSKISRIFKCNKYDDLLSDFNYDDEIEAALNYLDNHPNCTIEEYEEWLTNRELARQTIKSNYEFQGE